MVPMCCWKPYSNWRVKQLDALEAIQGHLEMMRQFGDPIPAPTSLAGEVEIVMAA